MTAVKAPNPWGDATVPEWMLHAYAEVGTAEVPGVGTNPRIAEYFRATTLGTSNPSDETAWCSAFACWAMERAGHPSPHRANARSWLTWGVKLKTPVLGCVVVFWRTTPTSAQGHVAFYVRSHGGLVDVLGGNQDNHVSVAPRPLGRVLGYMWPHDVAIPQLTV
jgi:uncharacterized protein (TIGR02594 family)